MKKHLFLFLCTLLFTQLPAQKVNTILRENWDGSSWQPSAVDTFTYDDNGYLIENLTQVWDTLKNEWRNDFFISYTNNDDGTPATRIDQQWQKNTKVWQNIARRNTNYTSTNKVEVVYEEEWQADDWANKSVYTNSYDGSDYLINSLTESWYGPSLINDQQTVYINNPDGTIDSALSQTWNSNTWETDGITKYSYTSSGKIDTMINEFWFQQLTLAQRNTFTYDDNGYLISTVIEISSGVDGWQLIGRDLQTNNTDGTIAESVFQGINEDTEEYEDLFKATYTYNAVTAIADIQPVKLKVFPNPATDYIKVEMPGVNNAQMQLTDITGKLIQAGIVNTAQPLNIKDLNTGMYFLSITKDGKRSTVPVIKAR